MRILENSFEEKNTYFIGSRIINGCQSFDYEEIDTIALVYDFDDELAKKISLEVQAEDEDWELLATNPEWRVRAEVARKGYCLDVLINDEDYNVRAGVARQRYGLEILVNDENYNVRAEVARQSFGLEILVNDEDYDVRCIATKQIRNKKQL